MRLLDRYILAQVVALFFACIFIFLFLYVIIDVLTHLDDILKQHTPIVILVKYYLSYLPLMYTQVAPFACLLSTLYALGKLNHNNEIIAMRSSGLSVLAMVKTVILFGAMVSLLVFWINDRVVPRAITLNQKLKSYMEEEGGKAREKKEIIKNLSMYGHNNRLFFVIRFSPATTLMEGITILEHDKRQNLIKKIVANKGLYKDGLWRYFQCITSVYDIHGQIIEEPRYMEEEIMGIPETPQDFINQREQPDAMSISQLQDYIWKLSRSGASSVVRNLQVELYQRYTTPLTSLLIILLGVPFALRLKRRATGLSSIGVSIMVGFLYYIIDAVCVALGNGGVLTPLLAVSLSHIIALTSSLYFINSLP